MRLRVLSSTAMAAAALPRVATSLSSSPSSPSPRTFLITGATDGIGRHTALKIASDGYGLVVHGRRPSAGSDLASELKARGASFVHYLNADLSDLNEVERLAEDVKALGLGKIDVLVNNAGVFDPPERQSKQGYDPTWAVNVMAPFLLTRRLLPLVANGDEPRIVTTSSISQSSSLPVLDELFEADPPRGYSAHSAYSHSKLGDLMFTVQLSRILKSQSDARLNRIKCLTMDPGTVNTKMLLAGWGACGINVKTADNTYKLAVTDYGAQQESGSYHFGFRQSGDSQNPKKLEDLWKALEEHTGCTYSNLDADLR